MTTTPADDLERRRAAANPPKGEGAELLEDGQEEVFSRAEVENGRIEHATEAGKHGAGVDPGPGPDEIRRDEAQTERQAPDNASPGEAAAR